MKIVKKILVFISVLLTIYLVLALFGPKDYKVTRSREINAPANEVYSHISQFNEWKQWSPWYEMDPNAHYDITDKAEVVGSTYAWSKSETVGVGAMTITNAKTNESINYELEFKEPWEMKSNGFIHLTENNGKTTVEWGDQGDIPFAQRPMMLFMNLDEMMGPDFERGLFKLDSLCTLSF